jgi:hypothetical protein
MQASSCNLQVKELQFIQPPAGLSGLLVFLQVGVAGLHPEGEWHMGSKIPTLLVPELHLPHAAAQLGFLLMLETGVKLQYILLFWVYLQESRKLNLCSELSHNSLSESF